MRTTAGTCSHCSSPVEWDEGQGCYVSVSAGGPDLLYCGGIEDDGNYHNVTTG